MSSQSDKLVIGISSRALFNLDEGHVIFETQGIDAYLKYQVAHENSPLEPGVAYGLVKKLLSLQDPASGTSLVEVVLLSRNSADTGLRVFNNIKQHNLAITRAVFTNGEKPYKYVTAFKLDLFLSANPSDVVHALEAGCAAATILPGANSNTLSEQLRIAFDGDAVLFSDEAERIYQEQGLTAFQQTEAAAADIPLSAGPFKGFLMALQRVQSKFNSDDCPIRTALVTARNAPAHERVIKTLRAWKIRIDEAFFLGGLSKADFLAAFGADFFFDDQQGHCEIARQHVATGHVPHGVTNTPLN